MIEDEDEEIAGVGMASAASPLIVVGRWGMADGAVGWTDEAVIKVDVRPSIDGMAAGTIGTVATAVGIIGGVTGNAGRVCASVRAISMASSAA